jgi:hypothetical protein
MTQSNKAAVSEGSLIQSDKARCSGRNHIPSNPELRALKQFSRLRVKVNCRVLPFGMEII